jgi:hypothetical protein
VGCPFKLTTVKGENKVARITISELSPAKALLSVLDEKKISLVKGGGYNSQSNYQGYYNVNVQQYRSNFSGTIYNF